MSRNPQALAIAATALLIFLVAILPLISGAAAALSTTSGALA